MEVFNVVVTGLALGCMFFAVNFLRDIADQLLMISVHLRKIADQGEPEITGTPVAEPAAKTEDLAAKLQPQAQPDSFKVTPETCDHRRALKAISAAKNEGDAITCPSCQATLIVIGQEGERSFRVAFG